MSVRKHGTGSISSPSIAELAQQVKLEERYTNYEPSMDRVRGLVT